MPPLRDVSPDEAGGDAEPPAVVLGLEAFIDRMSLELSGGQRRRVAIARAMAARARLMLFDEPTSGLDPITARTVDAEIIKPRDLEQGTSLLVTHQLRDAFYVATHEARRQNNRISIVPASPATREAVEFIMLKDGRIYFEGSAADFRASTDQSQTFLSGWVPPLVA